MNATVINVKGHAAQSLSQGDENPGHANMSLLILHGPLLMLCSSGINAEWSVMYTSMPGGIQVSMHGAVSTPLTTSRKLCNARILVRDDSCCNVHKHHTKECCLPRQGKQAYTGKRNSSTRRHTESSSAGSCSRSWAMRHRKRVRGRAVLLSGDTACSKARLVYMEIATCLPRLAQQHSAPNGKM